MTGPCAPAPHAEILIALANVKRIFKATVLTVDNFFLHVSCERKILFYFKVYKVLV